MFKFLHIFNILDIYMLILGLVSVAFVIFGIYAIYRQCTSKLDDYELELDAEELEQQYIPQDDGNRTPESSDEEL
jgi:hypothetical protein